MIIQPSLNKLFFTSCLKDHKFFIKSVPLLNPFLHSFNDLLDLAWFGEKKQACVFLAHSFVFSRDARTRLNNRLSEKGHLSLIINSGSSLSLLLRCRTAQPHKSSSYLLGFLLFTWTNKCIIGWLYSRRVLSRSKREAREMR